MSAGSSLTRLCKDLLDRMSSGFSQHLLTGTSRTLAKIFTKKDLPQNNPGTTVLCEPVQSKCTRTLEQFYARIYPKKCRGPTPVPTFCASLRSRNAHGHLTRAILILCENCQEKCRVPTPVYPRFVRACAVEMHMYISQEQYYARILRKMLGPNAGTSLRSRNAHSSRKNLRGKYRGQRSRKVASQTLCQPAQLKCTWTCHKSHFMREFTGKTPSARERTLIKPRPWLLYRKKPSVWTQCVGN